jgi:response regulator of citrate/malate metabolism
MFEEIFSEAKVDQVLNKYFDKKIVKESTKKEIRKNTIDKIKQLSENTTQEFSSLKVVEKYPNAKFVGKTISKGLVFEVEDMTLNVSTKGGYKVI